jgi:hypothetical protein
VESSGNIFNPSNPGTQLHYTSEDPSRDDSAAQPQVGVGSPPRC